MKKIFIFIIISSAILFLSSSAFAVQKQDDAVKQNIKAEISSVVPSVVGTVPGLYAGVDFGWGGMDRKRPTPDDLSINEEHHYGGFITRPHIGYLWRIPRVSSLKLGMELGYTSSYKPIEYILNNQTWVYIGYDIDLLGVAHYNIASSKFFLLGKAGVAFVHQIIFMSGFGEPAESNKNKFLPAAALGFGYDFTKNFGMNVVLRYIFGAPPPDIKYGVTSLDDIDSVVRIKGITIGATYHFG